VRSRPPNTPSSGLTIVETNHMSEMINIQCYSLFIFVFSFSGRSLATCSKWMVSIEGRIVVEGNVLSHALQSGIAALFASYFVFNLKYQDGAVATLEFFQRSVFVGIFVCKHFNPPSGLKTCS